MPEAPIVVVTPDMRDSTLGVIRSLAAAGLLRSWVTTVALAESSGLLGWLPESAREMVLRQARSRRVPRDLEPPLDMVWWREAVRLAVSRLGFSDSVCHRIWHWAELGFDGDAAARWAGRVPCIYGCEHASLETFRRQHEMGGYNLQWQVIAHQQTSDAILEEERRRCPEAATPYSELSSADAAEIGERKQAELELADLVICNSEYARSTFLRAGLPEQKVVAVPTGCPPVETSIEQRERIARSNVFLFAGTLSLRKGVHYLLEAWRKAAANAPAELWLVGKSELPPSFFRDLPRNVRIMPHQSRDVLRGLFAKASVLAFPTLCEGRARVILEAAAAGLALLTTPNSGCEDMVEAGVNGWLVPPSDVDALAEKIRWFLERRAQAPEMWSASFAKARAWGEPEFAAKHAAIVEGFLESRGIL